jgi:hypothetical protein
MSSSLVISLLTGLLVGWLNWKAGTWLGVLLVSILFFLPYLVFRQISGLFCSCVKSPSGRKLGVWRLQPLSKSRFNA